VAGTGARPSSGHHTGYTRRASRCAALGLTAIVRYMLEAGVNGANLLVLAPWLIFGACIVAIGCRLLSRRGPDRRRRRDRR